MENEIFKVYKYFYVQKTYKEILAENDYNLRIKEFILDINAKIGTQRVVKELGTIFEAAYWLCGSLSHDFRKCDDYGTVVNSLPDHKLYIAGLPKIPKAMDTLHAIVYLILEHDASFQRPTDTDEAFGRIETKRLAVALQKFSRKDKNKYPYDYSISIDRNWKDREVEEFMDGYWGPDIAAKKIHAFASHFDKDNREEMELRAFRAVCKLYKEWDGESCLGYEPQEYKDRLRESLCSLHSNRSSSNNAVSQPRILEKNPLFDDEELQQSRASQFVAFLKEHHKSSELINCSIDSYINLAFIAFYRKWEWKDRKKPLPNGSACFRFLKDYCELRLKDDDLSMKGYGSFIRKLIRDEKFDLKGVDLEVEEFLLKEQNKAS